MKYPHTTIFLDQLKETCGLWNIHTLIYFWANLRKTWTINYPLPTIFLGQLKEDVDHEISTHYYIYRPT